MLYLVFLDFFNSNPTNKYKKERRRFFFLHLYLNRHVSLRFGVRVCLHETSSLCVIACEHEEVCDW